jgi:nucleoid-associated protein YgaU
LNVRQTWSGLPRLHAWCQRDETCALPQRRAASTDTEDTMADDKNPAADNPYTQTHVVQSGDTLSKIAEKYYGDASLYTKIFQANRDLLSDPNKIRPGQKLRIP